MTLFQPHQWSNNSSLVQALRFLPSDALVSVSVTVRDLQTALEAQAGGPLSMTCEQAATHLGRTPDFWRRASRAGEIAGAYQDATSGPWHLPRTSCESLLDALSRRAVPSASPLPNVIRRRSSPAHNTVLSFDAERARGPRPSTRSA